MKKYFLLITTLLFTSTALANVEKYSLPALPECNIEEVSCDEEYYLLFVEFKTIKSFFERNIIPESTYLHYKNALDKLSDEKLQSYQEKFLKEQAPFFVEIPRCDYTTFECMHELRGFFNVFEQTVLLCNEGELPREDCLEYTKRVTNELKSEMEKLNNQ